MYTQKTASSPKYAYKLYYLQCKGLAEPIRMALAHAGLPFEDIRISLEDWPKYKQKMPFGHVPVLEVNGEHLAQSMAILRYLGKKHGLEVEDEWKRAIGDSLATNWMDMYAPLVLTWFDSEMTPELKKEKFLKVIENVTKPTLKIYEERFSQNGQDFVCGNKVTWCDFVIYNAFVMIEEILKLSLSDYPHLSTYMRKIEALPKIKEWQEQHPDVKWAVLPDPLA